MAIAEPVTITVDGVVMRARSGITVAAALLDSGTPAFRRSPRGAPRAPLCGMGTCFECRVTVDGVPHRRACLETVTDGMTVRTASGA